MSLLFFASLAPWLADTTVASPNSSPAVLPVDGSEQVVRWVLEDQPPSRRTASSNISAPELVEHYPDSFVVAMAGSESRPPSSESIQYSGTREYIVQSGDTLWAIAQRLNVSLSALMAANPTIVPKKLPAGYALAVPSLGTSDHSVAHRESLVASASASPASSSASSISASFSESNASPSSRDVEEQTLVPHTVQSGDTVWAIAQRHHLSTQAVLEANPGLVPKQLQISQVIALPSAPELQWSTSDAPNFQLQNYPQDLPQNQPQNQSQELAVTQDSIQQNTVNLGATNPGAANQQSTTQQAISQSTRPPAKSDSGTPTPGITSAPWLAYIPTIDGTRNAWKLGAIAFFGLSLTLLGWYSWQKRVRLQISFDDEIRVEDAPPVVGSAFQAQSPSQSSGQSPSQPASQSPSQQSSQPADQVSNQSGTVGPRAIAFQQPMLSPRLMLELTSVFGGWAAQSVTLLSPGVSAPSTISSPSGTKSKTHKQTGNQAGNQAGNQTRQRVGAQTRSSGPVNRAPKSPLHPFQSDHSPPVESAPADASPEKEETLENWSTTVQTILDQPPASLPQQFMAAGALFCLLFGTWAWLGTIEEVGYAQGELTPQGEVYTVQFPDSGRIINVAVDEGDAVQAG
ncbi:MAG: LysM peptidoglycan-binding domain-containing protein, partial [Merismopedia sp. SIO2A8]|nr:LysM peptidoglycan-binding domain-containing protein [Merismopedia sp. SIO2A8]